MKNSKKTWGMLGTSMGSMLIIVALLTMVGMGSNDTYAADTTCKCRKGDLNKATKTCSYYEEVEQEKVVSCPGYTPGYYDCDSEQISEAICKCKTKEKVKVPRVVAAECSGEDNDSSKPCIPGEYNTGGGTCGVCPSGSYCPGDGSIHACPANATCTKESFTCNSGYTPSGNRCVKSSCIPGEYNTGGGTCGVCPSGSYCPGDGSIHACPANATCTIESFTCNSGYKPSGNTCVAETSGDNDNGSSCSKANEPCKLNGKNGTCQASGDGFTCKVPNTPTGGDDKPNNPNKPTGGDDKPSNPNKPTDGGNNGGGNSGGNSGGNGNGGNTGGNNGNNNGGNNTTKNPNTATKAPLVIAIIGIISVGISSVVYFKGKKEINTEI